MLHPLHLFKTLSDETRLAIVMLLREAGELCVCDLCAATAESQPKVSRHMALLRESGLVIDRREGKWVHYRLSQHACMGGSRYRHQLELPAGRDAYEAEKPTSGFVLIKTHSQKQI
jgi:DNA-binding transcriptional ArsR family regulator